MKPSKLPEDSYAVAGMRGINERINWLLDQFPDQASHSEEPRRLKNGNWMLNGKMLSLQQREEMGLK